MLLLLWFSSCTKHHVKEYVICTQVPVQIASGKTNQILYPDKARIISFQEENTKETFKVLSIDFYSATSPDAFYTGEKIIFSAQKRPEDKWQIWELNLKSFKIKQLTSEEFNCTDPMYLPCGAIVFSGEQMLGSIKCHVLFKNKCDGSASEQISFHPHTDCSSTILADGRILFLSRQEIPNRKEFKLMAIRPDGTKAELFYFGKSDVELLGRAWETSDKRIVFTVSNNMDNTYELHSITYNSPFHSQKNIGQTSNKSFFSVFPYSDKKYLVVAGSSENSSALYTFNPRLNKIEKELYNDKNYHTFEPIVNKAKPRARKLPSAVNRYQSTGLLLCQNIHQSDLKKLAVSGKDTNVIIELMGMERVLGITHPKADGSVYLKVNADTPFQFRVKNNNGELIHEPSEWLWVRPNERRGCIGCHVNREMVPENYVPLAVKTDPVLISSETKGVKE